MAYSATYGLVYFLDTNTKLPLSLIAYESYQVTPAQRQDLDSTVNTNGNLIRHVVSHRRSKVEFNTPHLNNSQQAQLMQMLRNAWHGSHGVESERKVYLKYWDSEVNDYKTGYFYIPDITFTIRNIDESHNSINYNPVRVAFIEY